MRVGQCFSRGNLISSGLATCWLMQALPLCSPVVADLPSPGLPLLLRGRVELPSAFSDIQHRWRAAVQDCWGKKWLFLSAFFERGSTARPLPLYTPEHVATAQAIDQMKKCCQPLEVGTIKRDTCGRRIQAQPCTSLQVRGRLFQLHRLFELI